MSRVLVTGSADGLGHLAAERLLDGGHAVVVHVRNEDRRDAVDDLVARGAEVVVGDLADSGPTRDVAAQVNALGRMDAVIHNAGVLSGRELARVNVVAPYLLTALIDRPDRLVYLSSGMHRGGRLETSDLAALDWTGTRREASYSNTKQLVSALAAGVARRWPDVLSNSVDPGWVPTRMGGRGASDDLELGAATQVWLATSDDPDALTSGHYWYHQKRRDTHGAVADRGFQDALLDALAEHTGTPLP
ncbi:SDR family NAD(P)-dependent oxidoreductase [Nakamurella leprariae]|uniref:SDR family NAD(P)-dependent oxidoreductase n=1 Tax=Nakamurella leprariae TaxID=2803911 RepID=A0A938YDM6_9ACTN|nr:SDR family NAD(P)-dependent oxidoreductase [Nakamurella leprariae]MBM9468767.1 SDR family NAD(P)-dependent oxidoreductase [Nakamurella leprariae]